MIILFVHLERTRLRPAGYTQFSTGDRKGRGPVRAQGRCSEAGAYHSSVFPNRNLQKLLQDIYGPGKEGTTYEAKGVGRSLRCPHGP